MHRDASRDARDRRLDDTPGSADRRSEGRQPSPERTRGRDRSVDRHRDYRDKQDFCISPDQTKFDNLNSDRRHRDDSNRRDRTEYTSERERDRHPERLMRGRGDAFDQYTSKTSHRLEREEYCETDRYSDRSSHQHLDPSSAVAKSARSRRKLESMLRNDSLSSDPSDCVRPPPPKPHKHKKSKRFRQASLSSSDDEIVTTPECTSCDEPEIESESVSEKGKQAPGGILRV